MLFFRKLWMPSSKWRLTSIFSFNGHHAVIECKPETKDQSRFDDALDYIGKGYGNSAETQKYAVDGALWYASFLKD